MYGSLKGFWSSIKLDVEINYAEKLRDRKRVTFICFVIISGVLGEKKGQKIRIHIHTKNY